MSTRRKVARRDHRSNARRLRIEPLEDRRLLTSVGNVPILVILVNNGPGYENTFHPDHDPYFYRGLLDGSGGVAAPVTRSAINFSDTAGGSQGRFPSDALFPHGGGDEFVIHATATLNVTAAQAGAWTFGVNSDDGARLRIDGVDLIVDDALHSARDTFGTRSLTAGTHTLDLVYFDHTGGATVELFAAAGTHTSFGPGFDLIASGDGPGLHITAAGFSVSHRASTTAIASLSAVDALLAEPRHNLVDYFKENSNGKLTLVPATLGEILDPQGGDLVYDGIVGPVTFPAHTLSPEAKRRLAVVHADPWFNFSVYDTNNDGEVTANELVIISIGGDVDASYHKCTLRPETDFATGSFARTSDVDPASGRVFDIVEGTLNGSGAAAAYQRQYYAHRRGLYDFWTSAQASANCAATSGTFAGYLWDGANVRNFNADPSVNEDYHTDDGVVLRESFAEAGAGQFATWITLAHEISHVLHGDALDIYNYENVGGVGVGFSRWATMGATLNVAGSFHHDPWTKSRLGWLTPTAASTPGWYTLAASEHGGKVLRVQRNANEYFLIENRWRPGSYDSPTNTISHISGLGDSDYVPIGQTAAGVPDQGLAIWHVDETRLSAFRGNDFNAPAFISREHSASPTANDGFWDNTSSEFNAVTSPSSAWNDGTASDIVITDISAVGPTMSFYLDFTGVPRDALEPNDSFEFARNLGASDVARDDLTIHRNNDDYFRFIAPATGTATIDLLFDDDLGDVDISLHDGTDFHNLITSSTSGTDNEQIVASVVANQTYYLRIYGYNGAVNPDYDLRIDLPEPPGDRFENNDDFATAAVLGTGDRVENGLSIHVSNNDDYFRWYAPDDGELQVTVIFTHAAGDVDVVLYDGDRLPVASSTSSNDNEFISYQVTAGETYYVRVYGYAGTVNPLYDLGINGPAVPADFYEPNDDFEFSRRLGTGDHVLENLTIHIPNNDDVFRYTAADNGVLTVDLVFEHDVGDVDLYVYDAQQSLLATSTSSDDNEHVSLNVARGQNYYIRTVGFAGAVHFDYDLVVAGPAVPVDRFEDNDTLESAAFLGEGDRIENALTIDSPGDDDYYAWIAAATGDVNVYLYFEHALGDLDLQLLDADGGQLTAATSTTDDEFLTAPVVAGGTYFVRVHGYLDALSSDYTLWIDGPEIPIDEDEPNDGGGSPTPLPFEDGAVRGRSLHVAGDEDWYEWTALGDGQLTASLFADATDGDADLYLYDAADNLLAVASTVGDSESLEWQVRAGEVYRLRVRGFEQATLSQYDLVAYNGPIQAERIYVAAGGAIYAYNTGGALVDTFTDPLFSTGALGDVEIGPGGLIYVALDVGSNAGSDGKILEFTPGGTRTNEFALPDDPFTRSARYPFGFDVLEDGSFLVAQPNRGHIVRVARNGAVLDDWDVNPTIPGDATVTTGGVLVWSDNNQGQLLLNPAASNGYWVADEDDVVRLFSAQGAQLAARPVSNPRDVQPGRDGGLYVTRDTTVPPYSTGELVALTAEGSVRFATPIAGSPTGLAVSLVDLPSKIPGGLPDSDGDGLLDLWETQGLDINGDGTVDLNLPAMGADPMHKDVFVEVDAMTGRAPSLATLNRVVQAFAAVPNNLVNNPDGQNGINLHVTLDETNIPRVAWTLATPNPTWPQIETNAWTQFDAVKQGRFGTAGQRVSSNWTNIRAALLRVFRYAVFADNYEAGGSSGLAELPGNDFMVTLGAWPTPGGTADQQAGTFMHELGHTLNLRHGGGDDINFKPNYHSVMNYHWQSPNVNVGWALDYSRAAAGTLDESCLNEPAGLQFAVGGAHDTNNHRVRMSPWPLQLADEVGAVDFSRGDANGDGNASNDTCVAADLNAGFVDANGDGAINATDAAVGASPGQGLVGYADWSNILFTSNAHNAFADGVHISPPVDEIGTLEHEFLSTSLLLGDLNGDGIVGLHDVALLQMQLGSGGAGLSADLDGDGVVGRRDTAILAQEFGRAATALAGSPSPSAPPIAALPVVQRNAAVDRTLAAKSMFADNLGNVRRHNATRAQRQGRLYARRFGIEGSHRLRMIVAAVANDETSLRGNRS